MKNKESGKFINELIKENNLSNEELITTLNFSKKDLRKLKKGNLNLDENKLIALCNVLDISFYELINGYKGNSSKDRDNAILSILKYKEKQKKKDMITIITCFIGIVLCSLGVIWVNENKDLAYLLNGESENFNYENAMFLRDNRQYYIMFGNFEIKNPDIKKENITNVSLKSDNRLIISSNQFLQGMSTEKKGYDELFPKEVVKNIDNWYYEITYKLDDKDIKEILKLKNENLN